MELKLAQYNLETGKFERFLELGTGQGYFGYYGRMIKIPNPSNDDYQIEIEGDEKDPLNRFNGLFDGRTYGQGRFVLIISFKDMNQDDVFDFEDNRWSELTDRFYILKWHFGELGFFGEEDYMGFEYYAVNDIINRGLKERIGNIHENPELWERVK